MKTDGYIANHLSALVQVTAQVLTIKKGNTPWMEQFKRWKIPLHNFQGLLSVFECVVVIISSQKEIHTTRIDLQLPSLLWNFQYRELGIMPV